MLTSCTVLQRTAWAAPLFVLACGEAAAPGLPNDVEWRSQHFAYHARADDPDVCPGVLEQLERHFAAMQAATGFPWPEGRVIDYYKYLDYEDEQAASPCPDERSACARGSVVHSTQAIHPHELIHAYFAPVGAPPPIFTEGLATALACDWDGPYLPPTYFHWSDGEQLESYWTGQLLLSQLLPEYGWERFRELYGQPWQSSEPEEIAQRFESVYGRSIDEVWAAAVAATEPLPVCSAAWECAAASLAQGAAETPGERCGDVPLRSVDVGEPGSVLDLQQQGQVAALIACPADPATLIAGSSAWLGPRSFVELTPGRYFVHTDGETSLRSDTVDATSMLGDDCGALPGVPLEVPSANIGWVFRPRSTDYYLRLLPSRSSHVQLTALGTGPVELCASCAPDAECVTFEDVGQVDAGTELVLRFPAASPGSGLAQVLLSAQ